MSYGNTAPMSRLDFNEDMTYGTIVKISHCPALPYIRRKSNRFKITLLISISKIISCYFVVQNKNRFRKNIIPETINIRWKSFFVDSIENKTKMP